MSPRSLARLALVALAVASHEVRAEDAPLDSLTRAFLDASAATNGREDALGQALRRVARDDKARAEVVEPALRSLVLDLQAKRADPAVARLVGLSLGELCRPGSREQGLARLARPYLGKDAAESVRGEVVRALTGVGTAGLLPELLAIVGELGPAPAPSGAEGAASDARRPSFPSGRKPREPLLRLLVRVGAAEATPSADALALLGAVARASAFPSAQRAAVVALSERRRLEASDLSAALLPLCSADATDLDLAVAAADALWRAGVPAGFTTLARRLEAPAAAPAPTPPPSPSRGPDGPPPRTPKARAGPRASLATVYGAFCRALLRPGGFANVAPDAIDLAPEPERRAAVEALEAAWTKAAAAGPESPLLDALAAAGVRVPASRAVSSKDVVAALIEGLDLDSRELRLACLDVLARRTPRAEAVREWRTLKETADGATVAREEPEGGFVDSGSAAKLREQQRDRVRAWRDWWRTFSARATFAGGTWTASP